MLQWQIIAVVLKGHIVTHCPFTEQNASGKQPRALLRRGRHCASGFVSFRTRHSETSAPVEKLSNRKQCQGYLRL